MLMPDSENSALNASRAGPVGMMIKTSVKPDPSLDWTPFTMVARDTGLWAGYTSGDIAVPPFNPPVGTISNEPNPDYPLQAIYNDDAAGYVVAIFNLIPLDRASRLTLAVDSGAVHAAGEAAPYLGCVRVTFPSATFLFQDGETYAVTFSEVV